jgi:SAM-dependent methyltransferase
MNTRTVPDTWEQGDPYEHYVGRWSRQVAPRFLAWLALPPGRRWLDVGCGTGALSASILEHCAPGAVTGVEPSDGFRAKAQAQLGGRVRLLAGEAAAIPLADGAVDATVAGLVLNFVPDAQRGLREMRRVTAPGGRIAAYVWDYAERMEMMRHFWDAATELDAGVARLDEGPRFPMCQPGGLAAVFSEAGLREVRDTAIEIPTVFRDFDDYWQPFLGGQGVAPAYAMSIDEAARNRLRDALRARLPTAADGSIALVARAWAAQGTVPA